METGTTSHGLILVFPIEHGSTRSFSLQFAALDIEAFCLVSLRNSKVTPHNPVWLNRKEGHQYLANTLALKLVGLDRNNIPQVEGGTVCLLERWLANASSRF